MEAILSLWLYQYKSDKSQAKDLPSGQDQGLEICPQGHLNNTILTYKLSRHNGNIF